MPTLLPIITWPSAPPTKPATATAQQPHRSSGSSAERRSTSRMLGLSVSNMASTVDADTQPAVGASPLKLRGSLRQRPWPSRFAGETALLAGPPAAGAGRRDRSARWKALPVFAPAMNARSVPPPAPGLLRWARASGRDLTGNPAQRWAGSRVRIPPSLLRMLSLSKTPTLSRAGTHQAHGGHRGPLLSAAARKLLKSRPVACSNSSMHVAGRRGGGQDPIDACR